MTTSGSYSFSLNTTQLITEALILPNIIDNTSDAIDPTIYKRSLNALNMMLKTWEIEGIHLWKRKQATLFPALNQNSYELGSVSGADHCTNSYVQTTTSASTVSSASVITVTSATGLSNNMYIGLTQDDGTRIWGTISNVSGSTITCSFTTTTTAASGNIVVAYTSLIKNRPLNVIRATRKYLSSGQETKVEPIGFDEYFDMPLKTLAGDPCNFYYDRLLNNTLPYTGTLYLFPQPSNVDVALNFTYAESLQDMVNSGDTFDLPQEWLEAIVYNLAVRLCIIFSKDQKLQLLTPFAEQLKNILIKSDNDDTNFKFKIDTSGT